jgi:ubiquinone/menaquinone biosynthesis C-methylase UbiE
VPHADLIQYYADRAQEYERIYAKPERQADLAKLKEFIRDTFAGRDVLEVACGTGYWTEILAQTARTVLATDINDEVLAIARSKQNIARAQHVQLQRADAYNLSIPRQFPACLVAFWWSHIPKQHLNEFLKNLHAQLKPGATVVYIDNREVLGSSTPIHRADEFGNTYQLRKLDSGEEYEVLKNFPSESELQSALAPFNKRPAINLLHYYWIMRYET